MARDLTSGMLTAMNGQGARPFWLVQLQYSGGTQFLTTNSWDIIYDGDTYQANTGLLSVGEIEEEAALNVASLKVRLSGANAANLSAALSNNTNGRLCVIWFGLLASDNTVTVDPFTVFRGRFEQAVIDDGPRKSTIVWTLKNEFADFQRTGGRRTNDVEQQIHFAGDRGFEFAGQAAKPVQWGRSNSNVLQSSGRDVTDKLQDNLDKVNPF